MALFAGLVMLAGCYPSTSKRTEDLDVVATRYDEENDFAAYQTYYIVDTVIQIGDPDGSGYIDLMLTREEMDAIVGRVVSNMAELNYTRVMDPTENPDVGIFIEAIAQQVTVIYTYPPGWGWGWWPGWGPGWGPGWWYPPSVGGYSYPVGTLIVNYADTERRINDDGVEYIYVPWLGVLNGLLSSSSGSDQRVLNGIDQMFDQSQYLRRQ